MNDIQQLLASVVIATRNRKDELRNAIRSAMAQTVLLEILVMDDGSTDGTTEMVRKEFPNVRVERQEIARGYIIRRNEGARLAVAPIIFSIDDDAEFSSPNTIAITLEQFSNPCVGAVAIPFVNVKQGPRIFQQAPDTVDGGVFASDTYIGTAHALRRDVFMKLGGYREDFIHQGEEGDFCIRLLAAGYFVRLGSSAPIHHHESLRRDTRRMDFYGRRNDVLFALHNVPAADLPVHLAGTLLNGFKTALRSQHPGRHLAGLTSGLWEGAAGWGTQRRPVPKEIYRLHRRLKKSGPLPLSEIEVILQNITAKITKNHFTNHE